MLERIGSTSSLFQICWRTARPFLLFQSNPCLGADTKIPAGDLRIGKQRVGRSLEYDMTIVEHINPARQKQSRSHILLHDNDRRARLGEFDRTAPRVPRR